MNIWGWLYSMDDELRDSGHEALANYVDRIPSDTCDGRHADVDNYAEEAIALAREAGVPWVEVFLRHWRLQSEVLHRQRPRHMIKEAVSLLEFAHRPENRDCPQSICVVQDLANCYGAFDGPGFADERIGVCKDNLARIDARWPCYECIGGEYAQALLDAGRYDECVALLDNCDRDMIDAGVGKSTSDLLLLRVLVNAIRGDFDGARELVNMARNPYGGKAFTQKAKIYKAYVESLAGEHEKAMELVPKFTAIKGNCAEHVIWAEIVCCAHRHEAGLVTPGQVKSVAHIAADAEDRGAYRHALLINDWLAAICQRSGDEARALECIAAMKRVQPNLNQDLGAAERIAAREDRGHPAR